MRNNHIHEHSRDTDRDFGFHRHIHSSHCRCGCNDTTISDAEDIVDNALRFSKTAEIFLPDTVSIEEREHTIGALLMEVGENIGQDGYILGHIKALIKLEDCSVAFSITRMGTANKTYMGDYEPAKPVKSYYLTVNILSVFNTGAALDNLINKLFMI